MRKQTAHNSQRNRRAVRVGGKVYLSAGDEVEFSEDAADLEVVQLQMKEYAANGNEPYSFFTTFRPDHVLQTLTEIMTN